MIKQARLHEKAVQAVARDNVKYKKTRKAPVRKSSKVQTRKRHPLITAELKRQGVDWRKVEDVKDDVVIIHNQRIK